MQETAARYFEKYHIQPANIRYIIREKNKTSIYLLDGRMLSTYITMKDILNALPGKGFLRVNKSYILPVAQIVSATGGVYTMTDGRTFTARRNDRKNSENILAKAADTAVPRPIHVAPAAWSSVLRTMRQTSMEVMLSTFFKVLKVDLTHDSCLIIVDDRERTSTEDAETLSGWLRSFYESGRVHPDDVEDYERRTNLEYMRAHFRANPQTVLSTEYRRKVNGEFRWALMELIPAEDYTPEHQLVYLYVKDIHDAVGSSETTLWQIFQSLNDNFESIYYIDFEHDLLIPYRISNYINQHYGETLRSRPKYSYIIPDYVSKQVVKDDQRMMERVFTREFLEEKLRHKNFYSQEYRVMRDGLERFYGVKFSLLAPFEGHLPAVVMATTDITAEKRTRLQKFTSDRLVLTMESGTELADILRPNYKTCVCADDKQLLEAYTQNSSSVALVMVDIAGISGNLKKILSRIVGLVAHSNVPIMMVVPQITVEKEEKYMEMGVTDFIVRPIHPDVIRKRVENCIRLSESTDLLEQFQRDELTGLYEKKAFSRYAAMQIAEHPDEEYQIITSDIEDFKAINERYGWEKCSEILRELSSLLSSQLPGCLLGARIGGDIFVFLLKKTECAELDNVLANIRLWEQEMGVVVKLGITDFNEEVSVTVNCDHARTAMNSIKGVYGAQLAVYDKKFQEAVLRKRRLLNDAHHALMAEEFHMRYQPKLSLKTMSLSGAEANVRWIHEELGHIPPSEFISLFESNGFIMELDLYICRQICRDIRRWLDRKKSVVPVSINLSRRDFEQKDLVKQLCDIVDEYNVPREFIHFEITESAYASQPERVIIAVKGLHEEGFQIELDDFGSGYSSLEAVSQLELNYLKLDKSLIDGMDTEKGVLVLASALNLAKSMGLRTIAEGVENEEQLHRLSEMSCEFIQGYYYARPLPRDDFERFLE